MILHEALASTHFVERLLKGGDATQLLLSERLAAPARVPLEAPQALDLSAVALLCLGRFAEHTALGDAEEALRSKS